MKERLDINEHAYVILVPLSEEAQERMDPYDIYDNGEVAECFKSMVFGLETEEYMEIRLFDLMSVTEEDRWKKLEEKVAGLDELVIVDDIELKNQELEDY